MKNPDYRLMVLCLMIVIAMASGIKIFVFRPTPSPAVITVNDTSISKDRFNHLLESRSARLSRDEWIHSIIIKELLIQEALKAGIQTEETFRQSVQEFYEQSLIKTIMDRTYQNLKPKVDDIMVDRYMELSNQTVSVTLLTFKHKDDLAAQRFLTEEPLTVPFMHLSTQVKYDLLHLNPGESTEPAFSEVEKEYSVIRLDFIIPSSEKTERVENRNRVRTLLEEQKKERMIISWLNDLKKNAQVSVKDEGHDQQL